MDTFSGGGDFMRRPAMRDMLAYIDANPHQNFLVVFDDLSRLARDLRAHFILKEEFQARGVMLRCLNHNFDESPEGEFIEGVLAGKAQLDRKQNRRQVIQKQKARLDSGYWPFRSKNGYSSTVIPGRGKVGQPNKVGLEIIKPALEGFASGNLARKIDVARYLVQRGVWKGRIPDHCADDVTHLLQDPYYCGDIEFKAWGVRRMKGHHEGLISRETFAQIQFRLQKDVAVAKPRKDMAEDFNLRGLITCGACGLHLTGAYSKGRHKRYRYYHCQNRACSLFHKSLRGEIVENDFKMALGRNALQPKIAVAATAIFEKVWAQEADTVKWQDAMMNEKKTELKKKLKDLSELSRKTSSDVVRRTYEDQMEESGKELESIETTPLAASTLSIPYRTAIEKSSEMLKNPLSAWDSFDMDGQHRLFFFLFDARLPYFKNEGYRTADSLSSTRLFEALATTNTDNLDPAGFEPAASSLQMRRSTN